MSLGTITQELILTVLSQEELLAFERNLELLPETYDYSGHMTEEQLNKLISLLSRTRENFKLEANHYKSERDAYKQQLEETERSSVEKDHALLNKDRVIRDKNKQLAKKDKELKDLREQLAEAKGQLYGSKQQKIRGLKARDRKWEKEEMGHRDNNDDDNTPTADTTGSGGADRQQGEAEYDGKTPYPPVTKDKRCEGLNPASTGCTFNVENRPESYRTMQLLGVTDIREELHRIVTEHKFDRSKLPPGAVITDRKIVSFYTLKSYLIHETIEKLRVRLPGEKSAKWMYLPKDGSEHRKPVLNTKASPELLRAIAYDHYMKRVTIGCIHRSLQDLGMQISRTTLNNWLQKGKGHLDKLIFRLKEIALEKDCILNCDETWCKVRRLNRYTKKYMWVLVNKAQKTVIFFYDEGSRGRKVVTDFLGEAEIGAIMTDGYTAYNFLDGRLSVDHLICMAHLYSKLVKAWNLGHDKVAWKFIELIELLYRKERYYREKGYSPKQIYKARQSEETDRIEKALRRLLAEELLHPDSQRSYYMEQALNYFNHFKEGLFLYRKNGEYPIDNNLAERQVRPVAAQRKSSRHFGSDAGAEMAATYHSIVSTVLMKGVSVWKFFGAFFEDIATGGNRHLELLKMSAAQ